MESFEPKNWKLIDNFRGGPCDGDRLVKWSKLFELCELLATDYPPGQAVEFEADTKKEAEAAVGAIRDWCRRKMPTLKATCSIRGIVVKFKFFLKAGGNGKKERLPPVQERFTELFAEVDVLEPPVLFFREFTSLKEAQRAQSAVCNRLSARRGQGTYRTHVISPNGATKPGLFVQVL